MSPEQALNTDLYDVLGVPSDATAAEITAAYRRLARELHPDVRPDDPEATERFKEVSAAYDVLGDADKRAEYDQFRSMVGSGFSGEGFGSRGPGFTSHGDAVDLEDLLGGLFGDRFESFGGGNGFRDRPRRGPDAIARVPVSFVDAVRGTKVDLTVPTGDGERSVPVTIPAGTDTGDVIRVPGVGGAGVNGGPAGDLLVEVVVGSHPRFGRSGSDLTTSVTVDFPEAALGGTVEVPTLDGSVKIKVPAGTQPGRVMRVRGRGIRSRGHTGDLLVTVDVAVPTELNDDQRAAVEVLRAALED